MPRRMASLSAEGVEAVLHLEQKKGRLHLRDLLGWKEFDEVRDLRRSILLDLQYRSLVFAAEKGLRWPAVAEVGNLTGELLWETKGLSILQAIRILQDKLSALQVTLLPSHRQAVCDYFHNTFVKHYLLYQFVLTRERDRRQTFASLEVHAPPTPLPLVEGMDVSVWQYQKQLEAISAAEEEKRASLRQFRETLQVERENLLRAVYRNVRRQAEGLSKETLISLVKEAIKTQIQNLQDIIQREIQTTFEILQLKLQRKALMLNPPVPYPPPPSPVDQGGKGSKNAKKLKQKSSENKQQGGEKEKEEKKKKKKKEK
ncbi:uncharacterized protein C8orf74 homolog [Pogona vitticeps]